MTEIQRIIGGLSVLEKYNPNTSVHGKPNATWTLEAQELEFIDITVEDREALEGYGWRNRERHPYMWYMLSDHGLVTEEVELRKPAKKKANQGPKSRWATHEVLNKNTLSIFIAGQPILCGNCDSTILPEKHFSRSADRAGTKDGIAFTWCSTCRYIEV